MAVALVVALGRILAEAIGRSASRRTAAGRELVGVAWQSRGAIQDIVSQSSHNGDALRNDGRRKTGGRQQGEAWKPEGRKMFATPPPRAPLGLHWYLARRNAEPRSRIAVGLLAWKICVGCRAPEFGKFVLMY